jgi:hypothetical protein
VVCVVDVVWVFERRFVTRGCERELRPGSMHHLALLSLSFVGSRHDIAMRTTSGHPHLQPMETVKNQLPLPTIIVVCTLSMH